MSTGFDALNQIVQDGAMTGPGSERVQFRASDSQTWITVSALVETPSLEELGDDVSHDEILVHVSRSEIPSVSRSGWVLVRGKKFRVEAIDASQKPGWTLVCVS